MLATPLSFLGFLLRIVAERGTSTSRARGRKRRPAAVDYRTHLEPLEDRTLLSVYSSVQSGNWSNPATWGGTGVPGAGDTAQISNGTTVTVDQNTIIGSNSSPVGSAITIKGASASSYGVLQVATGVSLTLRGYDAGQNTLMLINRWGQFEPQPGSTILGDVASNYSSVILNRGQINAIGTAASPITFSSPAGNVNWGAVVSETHTNIPNSNYVYDAANGIAAQPLNNTWIANAAGTGPGSYGNSSLSFSGQSPATILQAEVGSYAAVNAPGDYYVNYDTGIVYFYTDYTPSYITYTATYDYLSLSKGWGINSSQNTSYNSAVFQYCNFSYMGSSSNSDQPALKVQNKLSAGADGGATDRLFRLTNSTVSNCYRFLSIEGSNGTSSDPLLIQNNTFNAARGDSSTYFTVGFYRGAANSYLSLSNNSLNLRGWLLLASSWGTILNEPGITVSGNAGNDNTLVTTSGPVLLPAAVVSNNTLTGYGNALDYQAIAELDGTQTSPVVISGNRLSFMKRDILFGPYNTIVGNIFDHPTHHGIIPSNDNNFYIAGVVIENNLFYGPAGGPNLAYPYAFAPTFVEPGTNHNQWIDGFKVINNTFLNDYNGGFAIGPTLDQGFTTLMGGEWTNNLILNTFDSALTKGAGVKRSIDSTAERFQAQVNALDYQLFWNDGVNYLNLNRGGTFLLGGSNYNLLPAGQRNVTGVSLSQPGYATPQTTGQSLAYTINSPGMDETLSWGGGAPVEIIFSHGTASSAANVTSFGVPGLWYGTLTDTTQAWTTSGTAYNTTPAGYWIKITGGTGAGQIRMIVGNTATQLTISPAWTVVPDSTSTYSIYKAEVTLTDTGGAVQGVKMTAGGQGYSSAPTVSFSGGGGSGAAGTAIITNGQVVGVTITSAGSGYTSAPTLSFSGGGGSGAAAVATLGTVQAGIDLRALPASSQTDSGIALAFNDVVGNPLLVNPNGSTAADFRLQASSAAIDVGSATDAPATDYFGTPRPQGAGFDIGFNEYIPGTTPAYAVDPVSPTVAAVTAYFGNPVSALETGFLAGTKSPTSRQETGLEERPKNPVSKAETGLDGTWRATGSVPAAIRAHLPKPHSQTLPASLKSNPLACLWSDFS